MLNKNFPGYLKLLKMFYDMLSLEVFLELTRREERAFRRPKYNNSHIELILAQFCPETFYERHGAGSKKYFFHSKSSLKTDFKS